MFHSPTVPQHPVLACAAAIGAALGEVAEVDPLYMSTAEKETALVELTAAATRLEELRLRVLASADDLADQHGARDVGAWLAHQVRLDDRAGRRDLALARTLQRRPRLAAAMRTGRVDRARAEVVARALDALPDQVPADVVTRAEGHLLAEAGQFNPGRLRTLGRKVLSVVAPEVDEDHERRLLEAEDAHATAVTSLHTRRRGDGTTDLRLRAADHVVDRLLTYLQAFTSPRQAEVSGASDRRPYPQRLGHAFGSLIETLDPTRLPLHGGDATTVIVTLDLDTLLAGPADTGVALVGDQPITAAQARRLACTAHLIPAVLDGQSQILDRSRRPFTRAQRKALALRDVTCRATGCTIPAAWCEAPHLTPWSRGGQTDLDHGVLLCSHHHRAHDHRYHTSRQRDGTITFHRRR